MLVLRVENFDRLADGGPLSFTADRRGFDFGRDQHLDWTLPDPTRRVSGKHCEIRFHDQGYWLYDISTNGTFINRSPRRVQSPYRLNDGDELVIGEYVVSVAIVGVVDAPAPAARPGQDRADAPPTSNDLWTSHSMPPPPISRQELMPEVARPSRANDFINSVADLPPVQPHAEAWAQPPVTPGPASADPWAPTGAPRRPLPPPPPPPPVATEDSGWSTGNQAGGPISISSMARDVPFSAPNSVVRAAIPAAAVARTLEEPVRPPPPPPPAPAGPSAEAIRAEVEREFIQRLAAGANVPEAIFGNRRAGDLAVEAGEMLRICFANLMHLLKARAEAKNMARTGSRTMIESLENNALKFTPNPEAAFAIIFGPASSGYLDGKQTLDRSFADLKVHEAATFSAMQHAIMAMFEDLSPQAISEATGAGSKMSFLGGGKSKNWDLFCERWNAKAGSGEHGMVDAFLDNFAAFYDEATPKRRS